MDELFRFLGRLLSWFRLIRMAVMAGPAGHLILVVEVRAFDIAKHFEHFSRGSLCWLVIFLPLELSVAVSARNAKIAADGIHCNQHLCRGLPFEDLDALENVLGMHRAIHAKP